MQPNIVDQRLYAKRTTAYAYIPFLYRATKFCKLLLATAFGSKTLVKLMLTGRCRPPPLASHSRTACNILRLALELNHLNRQNCGLP